jgi:hypothetical protein
MVRKVATTLSLGLILLLPIGCDQILDKIDGGKKGNSEDHIIGTDLNPDGTPSGKNRIYYIENHRVVRGDCQEGRPPSKEFCDLNVRKMLQSTFADKLYEKRKLRVNEINRIIAVYDEQITLATAEGLDTTSLDAEKNTFAAELNTVKKEIGDIDSLLDKMQSEAIVYNVTADAPDFPKLKPYVQRFPEIFRSAYLVSAGKDHTCITDDSGMKCWGGGSWGGMTEELRKVEQVRKFRFPVDMVSGDNFACVLEEESVHCFGTAQYKPDIASKYPPAPTESYTKLYASRTYLCGILENSTTEKRKLNCDGKFATGFGISPSTVDLEPGEVVITAPDALCILSTNGKGRCIDRSSSQGYYPMEGDEYPKLFAPKQAAATNLHLCAIHDEGLVCWQGERYEPLTIAEESKFPREISAYGDNICAINNDRTVSCFGKSDQGETIVPPLKDTAVLSVGTIHACALDGRGLKCWGAGAGDYGQAKVPDGLRFEQALP